MMTNGHAVTKEEHEQNLLEELVSNVYSMRKDLFDRLLDRRRDVYKECGWPKGPVPAEDLQTLFEEDSIAQRVVECICKESWQTTPSVYASKDPKKLEPFDVSFRALDTTLRGEKSWFRAEGENVGSPFWDILIRADIQSRISRYGVLVLGFDDCRQPGDMAKPVMPGEKKLVYMKALPEYLATINSVGTERSHPTFGRPTSYNITYLDPRENYEGTGFNNTSETVHWTRVIHITDGLGPSFVFNQPAMRPVLNEILGIQKIKGAGSEGYWLQAFATTVFESIPQLGGNVKIDAEKTRDMWERVRNGLDRAMVLMGMQAKTLAPQVMDPTPFINILIDLICIKLGIPVRIFKGSERGELASSQDDGAWNDRLRLRQDTYLTPRLVVPVVDRLIWAGALPPPSQGYTVGWPDLESQTAMERAQVFATRMGGFAQYISGQVETILPPMDMMVNEAGFTEEEASTILGEALFRAEGNSHPTPSPQEQGGGNPLDSLAPSVNEEWEDLPWGEEIAT